VLGNGAHQLAWQAIAIDTNLTSNIE
jgi:hypothetical protein